VAAINAVGTGNFSIFGTTVVIPPPKVPGAPTMTGSTPSAGAITVTFSPPTNNGGLPITNYTTQCLSGDGGAAGLKSSLGSPMKVTNLSAGMSYFCRVRATTAAGNGAYSSYGSSVVIPPAAAPTAPSITTSSPSAGAVTVAFNPSPNNGGSPVTGYTALCTSTDGGATRLATGTASPIKVVNLTVSKSYHCRVRATNAAGTGAYGAYGSTVTLPGPTAPPGPAVTGSTPSAGAVTVAFTTPNGDGGSPITGYYAACTSTDGGTNRSATGTASPIKVVNLTVSKSYHCRVRATNAIGTGAYGAFGATVVVSPDQTAPRPAHRSDTWCQRAP
jgi:hypothetical protein